jgi:membrane protease YdiL (CAAX protease family)
MNAPSITERGVQWRRRLVVYLILVAIGAAGLLLKRPFGLFLYHLMGKATSAPRTPLEWLTESNAASIAIVAVGLLLHHRSGLPTAPGLERLLFKDVRRAPRPMIWRPGLVGALVSVAIFATSQAYQTISGAPLPLTAQLSTGAIPRPELMTLAALYPLGVVGAGLSEEVIFRFGLMSALMGTMSWARVGGGNPNNAWAFWTANVLQAAWFGFGHVAEGLVAMEGGGWAFATLTAPQTWSGLVFGYVFRRWGLEAAIIAHMASDALIPVALACWRLAIGH